MGPGRLRARPGRRAGWSSPRAGRRPKLNSKPDRSEADHVRITGRAPDRCRSTLLGAQTLVISSALRVVFDIGSLQGGSVGLMGDLRLTTVTLMVLDVIDEADPADPAWGLRICETTGLGTGSVYPALDRLLKSGWINDCWETPSPGNRPRRRFYRMTDEGRSRCRAARAQRAARVRRVPAARGA